MFSAHSNPFFITEKYTEGIQKYQASHYFKDTPKSCPIDFIFTDAPINLNNVKKHQSFRCFFDVVNKFHFSEAYNDAIPTSTAQSLMGSIIGFLLCPGGDIITQPLLIANPLKGLYENSLSVIKVQYRM